MIYVFDLMVQGMLGIQLEELCRIASTLYITEEIKNEIQILCNALNTKKNLKKCQPFQLLSLPINKWKICKWKLKRRYRIY